jgi:four helix bundle protein
MGKFILRSSVVGEAGSDTIRAMRPLLKRVEARDPALARQLVRALTNVAMAIGRAELPQPGGVRQHILNAVGSANEARALLQMIVDWRYCTWRSAKRAYEQLDVTTRMLWHLAKQKRPRLEWVPTSRAS